MAPDTSGRLPPVDPLKPIRMVAVVDGGTELKIKASVPMETMLAPSPVLRWSGWRYPTRKCWTKYYASLALQVMTLGLVAAKPRPEPKWFDSPLDRRQPWAAQPRTFKLEFEHSAAIIFMEKVTSYKTCNLEIMAIDDLERRWPVTSVSNVFVQEVNVEEVPLDNPDNTGGVTVTFAQMM